MDEANAENITSTPDKADIARQFLTEHQEQFDGIITQLDQAIQAAEVIKLSDAYVKPVKARLAIFKGLYTALEKLSDTENTQPFTPSEISGSFAPYDALDGLNDKMRSFSRGLADDDNTGAQIAHAECARAQHILKGLIAAVTRSHPIEKILPGLVMEHDRQYPAPPIDIAALAPPKTNSFGQPLEEPATEQKPTVNIHDFVGPDFTVATPPRSKSLLFRMRNSGIEELRGIMGTIMDLRSKDKLPETMQDEIRNLAAAGEAHKLNGLLSDIHTPLTKLRAANIRVWAWGSVYNSILQHSLAHPASVAVLLKHGAENKGKELMQAVDNAFNSLTFSDPNEFAQKSEAALQVVRILANSGADKTYRADGYHNKNTVLHVIAGWNPGSLKGERLEAGLEMQATLLKFFIRPLV